MPKTVRRSVHKVKRNKGAIIAVFLVLIVAFIAWQYFVNQSSDPWEITEADVLARSDLNGKQVAVFGVHLGDTQKSVEEVLGKPDNRTFNAPDIYNWEYSKALNMNRVGLLLQFRSGILVRMTFKEPFNEYLSGFSSISHTKDEIYQKFGAPDDLRHVLASANTGRVYKVATYVGKNIEFIFLGDDLNGFSFFF
ncbi:MAG: hypothetical protein Q7R96_04120 [Nanoarchaeota archaeon]|nr:hypothetical protein [Nanoarchaeota archaeon]